MRISAQTRQPLYAARRIVACGFAVLLLGCGGSSGAGSKASRGAERADPRALETTGIDLSASGREQGDASSPVAIDAAEGDVQVPPAP